MAPPIGIDLGTKNSCIAVWNNGKAEVIQNNQEESTTPSCISFNRDGYFVGKDAEDQIGSCSESIYDIKRIIGLEYATVKNFEKFWSVNFSDDGRGFTKVGVNCGGELKDLYPEQLSAIILMHMKEFAEKKLKERIRNVVITVPAYFNVTQRDATNTAAIMAGLNVLKIISEPAAAALAYGTSVIIEKEKNVLIYDLGASIIFLCIVFESEDED